MMKSVKNLYICPQFEKHQSVSRDYLRELHMGEGCHFCAVSASSTLSTMIRHYCRNQMGKRNALDKWKWRQCQSIWFDIRQTAIPAFIPLCQQKALWVLEDRNLDLSEHTQ